MNLLTIIFTLCVAAITYYCYTLYTSYLSALKIGLPIVLCPVNPLNIIWLITSVPLRPLLSRVLPKSLWQRLEVITYGFEFSTRGEHFFKTFGRAYTIVGPGSFEVWLGDAELVHLVLNQRKGYEQADTAALFMGRFGPNVLSSHGEDWQRQRRIVAPAVNERISETVWTESRSQVQQMMSSFRASDQHSSSKSKRSVTTDLTIEGLRNIAINVLGAAGYGQPRKFGEVEAASSGMQFTFMEALFTIVNNLVASSIVPQALLNFPAMPKSVRELGRAVTEFPMLLTQRVDSERTAKSDLPKSNLLSTLVRMSDQERQTSGTTSSKSTGFYLTEEELRGNLYLLTLAGFDTTANTMAYACCSLAVHPELQEWIYEEISQVCPPTSDMNYTETFPKLKRCLALMYETLRLYPPVIHSVRKTTAPTTLTSPTTNQTYHFPADLEVYVCAGIVSVDPSIWGPSALIFDPSRWLSASGDLIDAPIKGSFVPWSAGPRACPGAKMAQVEFVSVFCEIVRGWRVEAAEKEGQSKEQARERLQGVMLDSAPRVTLQMNRPRDAVLRFVKR